jgi:transcription termination/antitermination protein NusG
LCCWNLPWFAIRVKSRFERAVSNALRYKGFEEFFPTFWSRRRWSDRIKVLQLPLFPGYVFCRFDSENRSRILAIPGVVLIVGLGKTPLPVNPVEIEAIRLAVNSGQQVQPWRRLGMGRKVRIAQGPLCGVEGVLQRFKGSSHLILGIELLQRRVAVEVHESWVVPSEPVLPIVNGPEIFQVQ